MFLVLRQRIAAAISSQQLTESAKLTIQLALLFMLVYVGSAIAFGLAWLVLKFAFGIASPSQFLVSLTAQMSNIPALLTAQAIVSTLGTFLFPAWIFHWLTMKNLQVEIKLNKGLALLQLLRSILLIFFTGIFIQLLVAINTNLPLPSALHFLREGQHRADTIIQALFNEHSLVRFLSLTLVVAVLPAVSEEIFFRGTLMRLLLGGRVGMAGAIILSALCFSFMHLEFDNFLAIWWMGIMLGCIYHITQSLWASIAAHFFNNFLMVAGKMAYETGMINEDVTANDSAMFWQQLLAGAFMCVVLWNMNTYAQRHRCKAQNPPNHE